MSRKHLFFAVLPLCLLTAFTLISGCMSISTFKESIVINASADKVFRIITNYECYDEFFPDLHDDVVIVSENKQGHGVKWKSIGSFKGVKFTTVWVVSEFVKDERIRMHDVENENAFVLLTIDEKSDKQTLYTMLISTKMYKPYEQEFFAIYRKEMNAVKHMAERVYTSKKCEG